MGIDPLNIMVLCKERCRCLLTDALHPRHIVRSITPEGQEVNHLPTLLQPMLFRYLLRSQLFKATARAVGLQDADILLYQLPIILIWGNHIDHTVRLSASHLRSNRTNHIIRLIPRHRVVLYAKGIDQLLDIR